MINVSNLSKTYKDTTVLSIESLQLSKGEIIGLSETTEPEKPLSSVYF